MSMMMIRDTVKIAEVYVIGQHDYECFLSNQSRTSLSDGHKIFFGGPERFHKA